MVDKLVFSGKKLGMEPVCNNFSFSSYYLETWGKNSEGQDVLVQKGTGFLYEKEKQIYLITNWHVITNKEASSPTNYLNDVSIQADRMVIQLIAKVKEEGDSFYVDVQKVEVPLIDNSMKTWIEKTLDDGSFVDIAIIPVSRFLGSIDCFPINTLEESFNENTKAFVGQDVFVLGYPWGDEFDNFPVWKRASIATEPDYDINNRPIFLVDTATRPGMSGSPVMFIEKRPVTLTNLSENKISRNYTKLLGIYSGAYKDTRERDFQLGIVWRKELIDVMIDVSHNGETDEKF